MPGPARAARSERSSAPRGRRATSPAASPLPATRAADPSGRAHRRRRGTSREPETPGRPLLDSPRLVRRDDPRPRLVERSVEQRRTVGVEGVVRLVEQHAAGGRAAARGRGRVAAASRERTWRRARGVAPTTRSARAASRRARLARRSGRAARTASGSRAESARGRRAARARGTRSARGAGSSARRRRVPSARRAHAAASSYPSRCVRSRAGSRLPRARRRAAPARAAPRSASRAHVR